nr:hypothetical protein [Ochrobactrum sp. LM19]
MQDMRGSEESGESNPYDAQNKQLMMVGFWLTFLFVVLALGFFFIFGVL